MAAAAARRALLADVLLFGGRGLLVGGATALIAVGAGKIAGRELSWEWVLGVALGLGMLSGIAWAVSRRWSRDRAAAEVDRALGLKDRLASSLAFSERADAGSFESWAVEDAEAIAGTTQVARVIPLRAEWTWGVWPGLAAAAMAVGIWVPVVEWDQKPRKPEPTLAERQAAAATIKQAGEAIKEGVREASTPVATDRELRALDELQRELSEGKADPQQAVTRAAGKIEDLASKMESEAEAKQRAEDRIREQLAQAAKGKGESESSASSPLMEAMKQGDTRTASELMKDAADKPEQLTQEERRQLAEDLETLARDLESEGGKDRAEEAAPVQKQKQPERAEKPEAPESGAKGAENPPSSEAQHRVEEGQRPEAEQDKQQEQKQAADREKERREELRKSLRDAARELRGEKQEPRSADGQQPSKDTTKPESEKGNVPRDQGTKSGDQKKRDSEEGEPKRGDKPGAEPRREVEKQQERGESERREQGQQGATGEQRGEKGEEKRAPGERGPTGQQGEPRQDGDTHEPRAKPDEKQEPGAKNEPAEKQEGVKPESSGEPRKGGRPDAGEKQPGERLDGEQQGEKANPEGQRPGEMPKPGEGQPEVPKPGEALERLAKELKKMAQPTGDAARDQQRARDLREMARKMMENATPEQREQFRKMAEEFAKKRGGEGLEPGAGDGPGDQDGVRAEGPTVKPYEGPTTPVDARKATVAGQDRPRERTVAEWYSDKPVDREGKGVAPTEMMREAARGAERAIEQQQVPARYQELVRRVFRRYSEQGGPKQ